MADKKQVQEVGGNDEILVRARDFWGRNNKKVITIGVIVILLAGGWLVYQNFVKEPNERKAAEAMFRAEEYFRMDSVNLALNGDGQHLGFARIISRYGGTKAGNLARYYAGSCYLKLGDAKNAITHLKKFSTKSKPVQVRAYKLLADAYADAGNNNEAFEYYKKAARHFEEDKVQSAEALFMAAYFAQRVLNKPNDAIALYKELKEKYPSTPQGQDSDNYLAQLGVYETN